MALATFNKHFGKYGEIVDSVIMKDRFTGQPRGFGFITYADPSVVDKVIEDSHIINGKQVEDSLSLALCILTDFVILDCLGLVVLPNLQLLPLYSVPSQYHLLICI